MRIVLAIAVLSGLVACGDDAGDGGDASAELVAAIAGEIATPDEPDDLPIPAENAQCMASDIVESIGVDRLNALGVTPESVPDELSEVDLSDAEVATVVDIQLGCVDIRALIAESIVTGGGFSAESATCLAEAVPDGVLRDVGLAEIGGDAELAASSQAAFEAAVGGAAETCLSPEELGVPVEE